MNALHRLISDLEGPQQDPDCPRQRMTTAFHYLEVRLTELQRAADRLERHRDQCAADESHAEDLQLVLAWVRAQPLECRRLFRIFFAAADVVQRLARLFPPRTIQ